MSKIGVKKTFKSVNGSRPVFEPKHSVSCKFKGFALIDTCKNFKARIKYLINCNMVIPNFLILKTQFSQQLNLEANLYFRFLLYQRLT